MPTKEAASSCKKNTLFRKQVVEYTTACQFGTVILTRPISHIILTSAFVTLALLIIAFLLFFETIRKAPIQGMLVPTAGVIRVFSTQAGAIKDIRIKEGQYIQEGEILFVVSSERSTSDPSSTEALVSGLLTQRRDSFQHELQQTKVQAIHRLAALRQRAKDLQEEIRSLDTQALMQQQRITLSEQTVARFAQLKATNYILILNTD